MKAGHDGKLEEVFGTGTAAVISPVGELRYKDDVITINDFKIGELTQKLYDTLTGIQWGKLEDKYGWTVEVKSVSYTHLLCVWESHVLSGDMRWFYSNRKMQ